MRTITLRKKDYYRFSYLLSSLPSACSVILHTQFVLFRSLFCVFPLLSPTVTSYYISKFTRPSMMPTMTNYIKHTALTQ